MQAVAMNFRQKIMLSVMEYRQDSRLKNIKGYNSNEKYNWFKNKSQFIFCKMTISGFYWEKSM